MTAIKKKQSKKKRVGSFFNLRSELIIVSILIEILLVAFYPESLFLGLDVQASWHSLTIVVIVPAVVIFTGTVQRGFGIGNYITILMFSGAFIMLFMMFVDEISQQYSFLITGEKRGIPDFPNPELYLLYVTGNLLVTIPVKVFVSNYFSRLLKIWFNFRITFDVSAKFYERYEPKNQTAGDPLQFFTSNKNHNGKINKSAI